MKLIQCVPNFSEGRDPSVIEAITGAIRSASGVMILDVESDRDHNRSVITFLGAPEAVAQGAFLGAQKAAQLIDMTRHQGEHPRMGATDVIPFTPLVGVDMAECISLAKSLGERLAQELKIPVYLYGFAANQPERENLANIRKGEFEGLREAIGKDPARHPDFGEARVHPTAGASAVGAREHIINFNVNLASDSLELAKDIAKRIRTSSGGLPHLRAKEIQLAQSGKIQISTVLTNFRITGLKTVYEAIRAPAAQLGVQISETELIGMVPAAALMDFAGQELRVAGFDPARQVLESKLLEFFIGRAASAPTSEWTQGLASFCSALAEPKPVPGGGSAAAGLAAIGVSLALKVCRLQFKKSQRDSSNGHPKTLAQAIDHIVPVQEQFLALAGEDAVAYHGVTQAYRLDKNDPLRESKIQEALKAACEVPLKVFRLSVQQLLQLGSLRALISSSILSDYKVGFQSLVAGSLGAKENVLINLELIRDETYRAKTLAQLDALEASLKTAIS